MKIIKNSVLSILIILSAITAVSAEVTYKNTLNDELESFKWSAVYITNSNRSNRATLSVLNGKLDGMEPSKVIMISNPESNQIIGNCYGYKYTCTLMVKFDDREAKPYKFKANVENDIYSLEASGNASFMKEVKASKIVKTKINSAVFTFDVSNVDFGKIEF